MLSIPLGQAAVKDHGVIGSQSRPPQRLLDLPQTHGAATETRDMQPGRAYVSSLIVAAGYRGGTRRLRLLCGHPEWLPPHPPPPPPPHSVSYVAVGPAQNTGGDSPLKRTARLTHSINFFLNLSWMDLKMGVESPNRSIFYPSFKSFPEHTGRLGN